jgi:hypothetical protein
MRTQDSDIDLAEVQEASSRAINRIRAMIPRLIAAQELERVFMEARGRDQNYAFEPENNSRVHSDRT